ncbi:hypothetical protein [Microcystis sp. M046S2]|uniref:hypothetical protein n=1 Tax=Microcystis sp. M046S2 TaxID=2771168 RepID=UPI002583626F|nr:hypothetical protein [Microcystis sp. M046S2]
MKRQPHSATTLKKWRGEESPSVLRRRGCQQLSAGSDSLFSASYLIIKITAREKRL